MAQAVAGSDEGAGGNPSPFFAPALQIENFQISNNQSKLLILH